METVTPLAIATNAPIWVWPLFVLLLFIGIRSSKDREVSASLYYLLPLIGLMAIPKLLQIGRFDVTIAFLGVYLIGCVAGWIYQRNIVAAVVGNRVRLSGEWVTLISVMAIFFASFAFGIVSAIVPSASQPAMLLYGLVSVPAIFSGMFLGRSLRVIECMRTARL